MSRTEILMSSIPGIKIRPADLFPTFAYHARETVFKAANKTLNTSQTKVSKELVEQRRQEIRNGERPAISVGLQRMPNDPKKGFYWLYDGHHTYAAYRLEGITEIPAYLHESGHEIGGPTDAPKYQRKRKT